jgi:hypothetical protein
MLSGFLVLSGLLDWVSAGLPESAALQQQSGDWQPYFRQIWSRPRACASASGFSTPSSQLEHLYVAEKSISRPLFGKSVLMGQRARLMLAPVRE